MTDEARFLEECAELVGMLGDIDGKGAEWAESATDTVVDISKTVENTGRVTERQDQAIQNIRRGAERWLR